MSRRLQGIVIGVIVGALFAGGVAYAVKIVPPNSSDRYYACVGSAGAVHEKTIRLNSPPTSCLYPSDKIRSWSAQGPSGVTGPVGATGPTGTPGSDAASATTARIALPAFGFGGCNSSTEWVSAVPGTVGCTDPAWASQYGLPLDAADYPSAALAHFTGVLTAQSSSPSLVCVRLYNVDAHVAVPNTTGCYSRAAGDGSYQSFDIGPFHLPDGGLQHYLVQSRLEYPDGDGWAGDLNAATLVIAW
jgi:hypothetical protein